MKLTALFAVLPSSAALAETGVETIRISILHSLSGTTAISGPSSPDTMLMLIEQQKMPSTASLAASGRMVDPLRDLRWNWRELRCAVLTRVRADARTKALELIAGRSGTAAQALSVPSQRPSLTAPHRRGR